VKRAKSRYEYEEVDKDVSMRVEDYFGYLERREEVLEKSPHEGVSTSSEGVQCAHRQFSYTNSNALVKLATLDVLDDIIYVLDYDASMTI
jgi:hypothetical protein